MSTSIKGYNRLAPVYVWLERLAFGNALMKARLALMSELKEAKQILILGEGDGRFLRRAFDLVPRAQFVVLEQSPKMIELAKNRFSSSELRHIDFITADISTALSPNLKGQFDVIISCFFLDMFETAEIRNIIETFSPYLKGTKYWYYVDFRQADKGWQAFHSRVYLRLMYWFFAWQTGLKTQDLVNPHSLFEVLGFKLIKRNVTHFSFLTTCLYQNVN